MLVLVALVMAAGCTADPPSAQLPRQGEDAIQEAAVRLDFPFGTPTGPLPTLPDTYEPMDFYKFMADYQTLFSEQWTAALRQAGLYGGMPGDLRFLTRAKGDGPQDFPTTCGSSNMGESRVAPASTSIFYCLTDRMATPEAVGGISYPQGTLWVPIDALMAQWKNVALVKPSDVGKGSQIAKAAFVYLTAAWADALTRQIRAYAQASWGIILPRMEIADDAQKFNYCLAGALGWSAYGDSTIIPQAVAITYSHTQTAAGPSGDPLINGFAAALQFGYGDHRLGGCVRKYWSQADQPAK